MSTAAQPIAFEPRAVAPLGRRRAPVAYTRSLGAYGLIAVRDPISVTPWPGQFYMLASVEGWGGGEGERPFLPRACSVARVRSEGTAVVLEFMLEDVGPGTRRLLAGEVGDELWLAGPLGLGFHPPPERARSVLVGGGAGVAPLVIWQDWLQAGGHAAPALLGFRSARHAQAAALFSEPTVATDDGGAGYHGPVTELLASVLSEPGPAVVSACGPPGMLEAVRALCAARGVAAQLALEAPMACGYGACFGCVVATVDGYARVCVDGPVFAAERLGDLRTLDHG
ncbi:MAG TPA: hypothetical protein VGY97_09175 [Solirubrobacteraceae bacterium]|nr:hypothetical protein [Solirubrobacteraceae bacterium]